jgi:hypothetical protein
MIDYSPAAILYDEYGNNIGSIKDSDGYRLLIESKPTPGSMPNVTLPSNPQLWFSQKLVKSGGGTSLLVNGSSVNVDFKLKADPTYNLRISEIRFVFVSDSFMIDGSSFGPITGLPNGILLETKYNGTNTTIMTIKQNEDFLAMYSPGGTIVEVSTVKDFVIAGLYVGGALVLRKGSTDYINAKIRDNLTDSKMRYLTVTIHGIKEL